MAYKQEMWDEAKKKCRLGDEEIRMSNFLRKLRNGTESPEPQRKSQQKIGSRNHEPAGQSSAVG